MHDLKRFVPLLLEGRAQCFVTLDQRFDAAPQRFDVQRAMQPQGQRNVVGRAVRLQLPENPLPLLGEGQCCRFLRLPREDRRDPVKIHPLTLEQDRQRLAFTGGQRFNGVKQLVHGCLS